MVDGGGDEWVRQSERLDDCERHKIDARLCLIFAL